jgi:hypothetical protein
VPLHLESTLLRVEELSRRRVGSSHSDVRVRVHLPSNPVGVARVVAVWADGPCRNMAAGAYFPLLLVPAEDIAQELRSRLMEPAAANANANANVVTADDGRSPRMRARFFVQRARYTLHAAFSGDQEVVKNVINLSAAADALRLPLLGALATTAMDILDFALEQQQIVEIDAMLEQEEREEANGSPGENTNHRDDAALHSGKNKMWDNLSPSEGKPEKPPREKAGIATNCSRGAGGGAPGAPGTRPPMGWDLESVHKVASLLHSMKASARWDLDSLLAGLCELDSVDPQLENDWFQPSSPLK